MHPRLRERTLAGKRLGLSTLRLVVAELEVPPPPVNVDLLAEIPHRHRRAFDVPPRPPRPELRRPRRLVGRRGTPEREVEGVALCAGADGPEQTLLAQLAHHGSPGAMRQTAVTAVSAHVDVERVRTVGVPRRMKLRGCGLDAPDLFR